VVVLEVCPEYHPETLRSIGLEYLETVLLFKAFLSDVQMPHIGCECLPAEARVTRSGWPTHCKEL